MKRHYILKEISRLRTRDKGTKSQPDKLWIHKTDAVIAQNKNEDKIQARQVFKYDKSPDQKVVEQYGKKGDM